MCEAEIVFPFLDEIEDEALELLRNLQAEQYEFFRKAEGEKVHDVIKGGAQVIQNLHAISILSKVVSWALYERAVLAGEMKREDVSKRFTPSLPASIATSECMRTGNVTKAAKERYDRSWQLYQRVSRLHSSSKESLG